MTKKKIWKASWCPKYNEMEADGGLKEKQDPDLQREEQKEPEPLCAFVFRFIFFFL